MTTVKITTDSPEMATIVIMVLQELERAETKHPEWPADPVKRVAIITEELGELAREANLLDEGKGNIENLKMECIQTASTCLRLLKIMINERK